MHFFPPPLKIDENEGFDKAKDIFGREKIGVGLTNLLNATPDPVVLAVNGQWGSGKSTFLKMWTGAMRNAGFPVIYFDAFEHDYIGDSFSAIAGEIIELTESKKLKPKARKKIKDATVAAGKVLLRAGLIVGAKAATAGLMSANDVGGIVDDAKEAVGDITSKLLEELLTTRERDRKTLQAFRDALISLPSLLREEIVGQDGADKPLIVVIDELDRCRPSFALEILERMKHFFSVPGVHFVLGVHLEQLENSVRVAYGTNIDARIYLQKFISFSVELDARTNEIPERTTSKYLSYLRENMEFRPDDQETLHYTCKIIEEQADKLRLSLRALERIMTYLAMALAFTEKNYMRLPPILAGLCMMKVMDPKLYRKAKEGRLSFQETEKFFGFEPLADPHERGQDWFTNWWRVCLDDEVDESLVAEHMKGLMQYNFYGSAARKKIVPITANDIIDRITERS